MTSMDPTEEEISQVIDFASLNNADDRDMVIQALKNNSRNVETVVMQYFDNPESFRQKYCMTWDDTMFNSDRDGAGNNAGISFHIESPSQNETIQGVTPPPEGYGPGAPSRPPSRTNSRSPLSRAVDWAVGDSSGMHNSQTQEDMDMQRALRESAQEAGLPMPQQESGVMDGTTTSPHFGPANRNDYDQGSWAMVHTGLAETKLNSVPVASLRQRAPGAPAFLIQGSGSTTGAHRLAGCLTILHEIPLARNILLGCGEPASSYGHNSEWWKGQEILPPHVLAQIQSGELQWGQNEAAKPIFEEEIHRLMAFLDQTERSYGTVSVLVETMPVTGISAEKQFYEHLAERNRHKLEPLTQVAALAEAQGTEIGEEEARFGLLDIEHARGEYASIKTLYEAIDHVMWSDVLTFQEMHSGSKMALFKEMGEVFAIRIGGDGPADSIEIPAEFYPEKYLYSRKAEAQRIQLGWCETKKAIERIEREEKNLYEWRDAKTNKTYDKREVIKKAMDQWKGYGEYLDMLGRFRAMEESGFDTNKYPDYRLAPSQLDDDDGKQHREKVEEVLQWAEQVLSDLELRMKGLNTQLEHIKAKQRFLGRLLTSPDKSGRPKPMTCKKYLLRGVATSTDVVYVCRRAEPDLIDLDEALPSSDQWWRLAYVANDSEPVKAEKIEIERVFREVWQETKTPILIYATEEAVETPKMPLRGPLERFVRAENKAFRQELNAERVEAAEQKRAVSLEPLSPSKRKHRADSIDSMDSNRASLGSDDRTDTENPFMDQGAGQTSELMDMSIVMPDDVHDDQFSAATSFGGQSLPPSYSQAMADAASATLTPTTLNAEDVQGTNENEGTATALVGVQQPENEAVAAGQSARETVEVKGPEMQERARLPAFIATQGGNAEQKGSVDMMDMEIPDHQA